VVRRAADHFNPDGARRPAEQRFPDKSSEAFVAMIRQREEDLRRTQQGAWGDLVEQVLTAPIRHADKPGDGMVSVSTPTRWG
jgi:hypothetical protein